jgi:thiol-disulfide isomerase/thioredoxin
MAALLLLLSVMQADLLSPHGGKVVVFLFVRSDCPISNRYAPEIQRLYEKYSSKGIEFRLIYPEPGFTAAAMAKHREEYGYTIPARLDPGHQYVTRSRVRVTPEAAVYVHGELIYGGRIDDRYVDTGKAKPQATCHDLDEVLAAVAAGKKLQFRQTKAVGCAIENLR